jgi:serine/threonine protein kinase
MDGDTLPCSHPTVVLPVQPGRADGPVSSLLLREVLAGFEFLDCFEHSPVREQWRVADREGRPRVAQLLRGVAHADDERWLDRLLRVTDPALPRREAVRLPGGQTVLLTEPWERTLHDRFQECRARGLPGVPREELLDVLGEAARALDHLQRHERLQHLNLHPRNILLDGRRVRLEGFGLAQLLWLPARVPLHQLNADYAARELHQGYLSAHCDQYSLALIFAEMLTGTHPVRGEGGRRSRVARAQGALRLDGLAAADRAAVARALDPHPQRRFASAPALLQALTEATPAAPEPPASAPVIALPGEGRPAAAAAVPLVQRLWERAGGGSGASAGENLRYRLKPGECLEHRCAVRLSPGDAPLRLEAFRKRWYGRALRRATEEFQYAVPLAGHGWGRLLRGTGLEVCVRLTALAGAESLQHVLVRLKPFGCADTAAVQLLGEWGPLVLASVREHLQVPPEQRGQDRVTWHQPLRVHPVEGGQWLSAIDGVVKDISPRGVGLYVPRLPGDDVYVQWPAQPDVAQLAARARVVRCRPCGDGWFEVGAVFEG